MDGDGKLVKGCFVALGQCSRVPSPEHHQWRINDVRE